MSHVPGSIRTLRLDRSAPSRPADLQMHDPVVVRLLGELDIGTEDELRGLLLRVVELAEGRQVLLDMHEVRFFDARTVGVIVEAAELAEARGGWLRVDPAPWQPRVFRMLGLERLLRRDD